MPKIRVLSFDFDGCLFHKEYIDSQDPNKSAIEYNQAFFDQIKTENQSLNIERCIVFVGSNRQSEGVDRLNWRYKLKFKGSCFSQIESISQYLDAEFNPFLMPDLYHNLPHGRTFKKAIARLEKKITSEDIADFMRYEWKFDDTKLSILYAQIHKMAFENQSVEIMFDFYDDRDNGILVPLKFFFRKHPFMIPENVTLHLHHYANKRLRLLSDEIKGEGPIDIDYCNTVKAMFNQVQFTTKSDNGGFYFAWYVKPHLLPSQQNLNPPLFSEQNFTLSQSMQASLDDQENTPIQPIFNSLDNEDIISIQAKRTSMSIDIPPDVCAAIIEHQYRSGSDDLEAQSTQSTQSADGRAFFKLRCIQALMASSAVLAALTIVLSPAVTRSNGLKMNSHLGIGILATTSILSGLTFFSACGMLALRHQEQSSGLSPS